MMVIKKTKTERELAKALADIQGMKQEREKLKQNVQKHIDEVEKCEKTLIFEINETARLKKLLETNQTSRNEMVLNYEKKVKEQQETINTLRDDLSNANTHITGLGERIYNTQNALKGYKEFSATLENDVKMMSKAIVKIMMGVE